MKDKTMTISPDGVEMRDVKGYEGLYSVTADGRVWSYWLNDWRKPFDNNNGYLIVRLSKNDIQKNKRVHILVAEAFDLPKPDVPAGIKLDVDHIDSNRQNNHFSNLCWKTRRENLDSDHYREAQKNRQKTKVRCVETGEVYKSMAAAGKAIGKNRYGINLCLLGKQETCGGFHWERVRED